MAVTQLNGRWRKDDFTGNNLILYGVAFYGRTSGPTFCDGTKVWLFGGKALNVLVDLGGCLKALSAEDFNKGTCIPAFSSIDLYDDTVKFFFKNLSKP